MIRAQAVSNARELAMSAQRFWGPGLAFLTAAVKPGIIKPAGITTSTTQPPSQCKEFDSFLDNKMQFTDGEMDFDSGQQLAFSTAILMSALDVSSRVCRELLHPDYNFVDLDAGQLSKLDPANPLPPNMYTVYRGEKEYCPKPRSWHLMMHGAAGLAEVLAGDSPGMVLPEGTMRVKLANRPMPDVVDGKEVGTGADVVTPDLIKKPPAAASMRRSGATLERFALSIEDTAEQKAAWDHYRANVRMRALKRFAGTTGFGTGLKWDLLVDKDDEYSEYSDIATESDADSDSGSCHHGVFDGEKPTYKMLQSILDRSLKTMHSIASSPYWVDTGRPLLVALLSDSAPHTIPSTLIGDARAEDAAVIERSGSSDMDDDLIRLHGDVIVCGTGARMVMACTLLLKITGYY